MSIQKERRTNRSKKSNDTLSPKVKKIWEEIHCEDHPKQKYIKLGRKLYICIRGKLSELVHSRCYFQVIQWLFVLGSKSSVAVFEELKPHLLEMMITKNGKRIVMKFLKHGTEDQRSEVIKSMIGSFRPLLVNPLSASVVEYVFTMCMESNKKLSVLAELYEPAVQSMKEEDCCLTLDEMLKKYPAMKEPVCEHLKHLLEIVIERNIVGQSIVHLLLREYLIQCSSIEVDEILQLLPEKVIDILYTSNGAHIGILCIARSDSEVHRVIVNSLKMHVAKICCHKYGYKVILALFEFVCDSSLLKEIIISEIIEDLNLLFHSRFGIKVISNLFSRRKRVVLGYDVTDVLKMMDTLASSDTTTYRQVRYKSYNEYFKAMTTSVVTYLENNFDEVFNDEAVLMPLFFIVRKLVGFSSIIFEKIVLFLDKELILDDGTLKPVCNSEVFHLFLKRLLERLLSCRDLQTTGVMSFLRALAQHLTSNNVPGLLTTQYGCMAFCRLLQCKDEEVRNTTKEAVMPFWEHLFRIKGTSTAQLRRKLRPSHMKRHQRRKRVRKPGKNRTQATQPE